MDDFDGGGKKPKNDEYLESGISFPSASGFVEMMDSREIEDPFLLTVCSVGGYSSESYWKSHESVG